MPVRPLPVKAMKDTSDMRSFGVFKPVGHVLISFASAAQRDGAADAMRDAGLGADDSTLRRISDREMVQQADEDLARASPLANLGQELNLVKAQRELALIGYHFLLVRADDDDAARRVAEIAGQHRAERAQHYGQFVVEELIQHPGEEAQVAESPDRGLDAQTPSGTEAERAAMRPRGGESRE